MLQKGMVQSADLDDGVEEEVKADEDAAANEVLDAKDPEQGFKLDAVHLGCSNLFY